MPLTPLSTPKDWQKLEAHPLSSLFPLLDEHGLSEIQRDIRDNEFDPERPIVLFEGRILDGRNRHRACLLLDAAEPLWPEPAFKNYSPVDSEPSPLNWVISVNLHRRHLSEGQRSMVAAEIANLGWGQTRAESPIGDSAVTQAEAAAMLNVSPRSVSRARAVKEADPELAEQVKCGRQSLHSAYEKVMDQAKQKTTSKPVKTEVIRIPREPRTAALKLLQVFTADEIGVLLTTLQEEINR